MKKYKYEIVIFILNAIYMILELIASRVLSPYFGSSNLVWTSVIGIILLSTSLGNYLGGIIADKNGNKKNLQIILGATGLTVLLIPLIQNTLLEGIVELTSSIRIGVIVATIALFFIPSMLVGTLSPIIIKLKMENSDKIGKVSGNIYAIATLGSIVGTFLGGFFLIPNFGSIQILFVMPIIIFATIFLLEIGDEKKNKKIIIIGLVVIILSILCIYAYDYSNNQNAQKVLNGETGMQVSYDTQYGRVLIYNVERNGILCRILNIDNGNESATIVDEQNCYELVYNYTTYYNLMFDSNIEIKDTLMIGGAGYSYPKYYISHYADKNMDVVEIDGDITKIAKQYFYLDKLIEEYDLENNNRLNIYEEDGRTYLNSNTKKYDAILNDAFAGDTPAETLTTIEAVQKIYNSLNENGVYLSNIISSLDGENSKFLKSEVKTLKQVFENVYIIPCSTQNVNQTQNIMVIATDDNLNIEEAVEITEDGDEIILTDNYSPVDDLIPKT